MDVQGHPHSNTRLASIAPSIVHVSKITYKPPDLHVRYDIFSFLSIPEKVAVSTPILLAPPNLTVPTLSITYFSAASIPFALPTIIARGFGWPEWGLGIEGVNSHVGKWLLHLLSNDSTPDAQQPTQDRTSIYEDRLRIRGWALADFYNEPDNGMIPLLVECNFRGRRPGEEGWI
jgi:1-phosphatidylinositol phosphodiesterase